MQTTNNCFIALIQLEKVKELLNNFVRVCFKVKNK